MILLLSIFISNDDGQTNNNNEMNIAILTQPLYNNYGGILQNYALQQYLNGLGHECSTINFVRRPPQLSKLSFVKDVMKGVVKKCMGKKVDYINPYTRYRMVYTSTPKKKKFIEDKIQKVDMLPPLTPEWCKEQVYEAYVVGSDQIWRPAYSPSILNFFLDFTEGCNVKRLSYAASFGVDEWEMDEVFTQKAKQSIHAFNGVSVREYAAVAMCEKYLRVDAKHVIDPTLLISSDHYRDLYSSEQTSGCGKYLLCYTLDNNSTIRAIAQSIAQKVGAQIKFVSGENDGNTEIGIEEWLCLIDNAQFVLTDSFHGTVFSILFHRPFATLVNGKRGAERVKSLLSMFSIDNRLIYLDEQLDLNFSAINWESVEDRLDNYRNDAFGFIANALK